jgi:hypothetical protein
VLKWKLVGHYRSCTCSCLAPLSSKKVSPTFRPVLALSRYDLRVGRRRQWQRPSDWCRCYSISEGNVGVRVLTKNFASLQEVVHPLLYCTCSDLGPQPMIGLCLRSRHVENRFLVASSCIILDLFIFQIYCVLIRFSWDLLHPFLFFQVFVCCLKRSRQHCHLKSQCNSNKIATWIWVNRHATQYWHFQWLGLFLRLEGPLFSETIKSKWYE